MEPFTYVMIVLLASWTVALVGRTRWAAKYILTARKWDAKSKALFVAQEELNAILASRIDAEKKLYARLETECASYESARQTIEELKVLYHDALEGKNLSAPQAECLAKIAARVSNNMDFRETRGLILEELERQWPRYEWRELVKKHRVQ